jgi:hypothetical protein
MKSTPKINMGWHCFKRMETQFGLQLVFFIQLEEQYSYAEVTKYNRNDYIYV